MRHISTFPHFHIATLSGLALLVWFHIGWRAAAVPWVHDECASLFWYVERGEWLPGLAHWDANNHVLSTLIGLWSYKLFGLSLFGSRVGSVLAFGVYAWAVWRIAAQVRNTVPRTVLGIALLTCPFALDFFSLFRGYGLELAFLMVALDGVMRFTTETHTRHLLQVLLALLLANAAVLALVPLWALVITALGAYTAWKWRRSTTCLNWQRTGLVLGLGVLPLVAAVWVSLQLKDRGLLYHGNLNGFVEVTMTSLARYVLGTTNPVLLYLVLGLMLFALVTGLRTKRQELLLVSALVWADVLARIAMAVFAQVNYPEDRAAIHLVPLLLVAFALLCDEMTEGRKVWRWAVLPLLVLPLRTLVLANTTHTVLWPEQSVPEAFAQAIADEERRLARPVVVGAYHQMNMTVPYAVRLAGLDPEVPHSEGFPHGTHDLRVVDERFLRDPMPGYRVIKSSAANGTHLLARENAFMPEPIAERRFPDGPLADEFFELLRLDTLGQEGEVWVEISAALTCSGHADVHLVVEQEQEGAQPAYRDDVALALLRPVWNGGRLHLFRPVRLRAPSTRQVVYFWNVRGDTVTWRDLIVRVHRLAPSN